jgi:hypothetical protein
MVHDLLSPSAVRRRGLLSVEGVNELLSEHERNTEDLAYSVWALLTLEIWCRTHPVHGPAVTDPLDRWSAPTTPNTARNSASN